MNCLLIRSFLTLLRGEYFFVLRTLLLRIFGHVEKCLLETLFTCWNNQELECGDNLICKFCNRIQNSPIRKLVGLKQKKIIDELIIFT